MTRDTEKLPDVAGAVRIAADKLAEVLRIVDEAGGR